MLRHQKTTHGMSEKEEDTPMSSDEVFSDEESELGSESDEQQVDVDPWLDIVNKSIRVLQSEYEDAVRYKVQTDGIQQRDARERTFRDMRSKYRKVMAEELLKRIEWMDMLKNDSAYRSIKKTMEDLKMEDDYSSDEAWKYAISKRKFLLENILREYEPLEVKSRDIQGGGGGRHIRGTDAVQLVDQWAFNELERIKDAPKIGIIGKKL